MEEKSASPCDDGPYRALRHAIHVVCTYASQAQCLIFLFQLMLEGCSCKDSVVRVVVLDHDPILTTFTLILQLGLDSLIDAQ